MRSRALWVSLVLALLVVAPSLARGSHPTHARAHSRAIATHAVVRRKLPPQVHIGTWGHGSWSWFGDPRAVHVVGQYNEIYVGWIDWAGHVTIGAYDPVFGVIKKHIVGLLFHDDHSAPSIFVEPDKRLTVFWSGHNGAEMDYRSTLRPEDISTWGPLQHVPSQLKGVLGFTYPNPVLLPAEGNLMYLFWRGADWSADYATRSLDGRWSLAHELIRNPAQRPYVKVDGNGRDRIALAFTDGHPRNVLTSVYYASYRAGSLRTAGGARIANVAAGPISPQQADLVYNGKATGVPSWVWDVAFDPHGRPVILYATFPSNRNHVYWYARWNGQRWISHFITFAGGTISPGTIEIEYSGGMTLDHANPAVVYLSRQVGGAWEIERWTTSDGGFTWRHATVVRGDGTDNVRPVVPRGWDAGPMALLWLHGHYGSYTDYRTSVDFLK
jgi:hypothetical protein